LLKEQSDAYALDEFIDNYNWDDGLGMEQPELN